MYTHIYIYIHIHIYTYTHLHICTYIYIYYDVNDDWLMISLVIVLTKRQFEVAYQTHFFRVTETHLKKGHLVKNRLRII